jgi:DNA-binding SARP family transcriptional activator
MVERDGHLVSTSDWRASAARELFFFLLFTGPVNREQINLEFWPDSSDKQARSRFHTTIYRARRALGEKIIVYENDLYLFNPDTEIWCDANELENYVTQARLHSPRDPRTEELRFPCRYGPRMDQQSAADALRGLYRSTDRPG